MKLQGKRVIRLLKYNITKRGLSYAHVIYSFCVFLNNKNEKEKIHDIKKNV